MMINSWSILDILGVGQSANRFSLSTNCYFCTAAALQGMDCKSLVSASEYMQYDTGSADNFSELFDTKLSHKEFSTMREVTNFLLTKLPKQRAIAFGYNRLNGTGHMIVVFNACTSIDSRGKASSKGWGSLRHIDYQGRNPQPEDGLLPRNESESQIVEFHIFHPLQ